MSRVVVGVAVVVTALVTGTGGAGAQTAGDAAVHAVSEGWWNEVAGVLNPPESPLRGLAPIIEAPAPDVPEGVVPVSMRFGEPERIGAIGIVFDAPAGSTVNKLVMRLKEADGSFTQQGTEPGVMACSITSFLVPEANGEPANMPEADCEAASAPGERDEDGVWSFDLTAIATTWLDPSSGAQATGVRLDPVGEPPDTFQVSFTGFEDAEFDADIVRGQATADPFSSGGAFGGGSSSFADSFASGTGGVGGDFVSPSTDLADVAAPTDTTSERDAAAAPRATAVATRVGDTAALPPALLPGVLVAILLAVLTAMSLGPAGRRRDVVGRRQGGVSRALSSRLVSDSRP